MSVSTLRMSGPSARGVRVAGGLLRDVLDTLVNAVQQSVRVRAEGRSKAAGPSPDWLERASTFDVEIRAGSTQLMLEAKALADVAPDRFAQQELFDPLPPDKSCLDLFAEALDDALAGKADSDLYDDGLIETFESFRRVFRYGVNTVELLNGRTRRLQPRDLESLQQLRRSIPPPQQARVAGKLDLLRHSNRMFELVLDSGETVRGVVTGEADFAAVGPLLGERVLVSGLARFRPSGRVLRLEGEQLSRAEGDTSVWASPPLPLLQELDLRGLRQPQGSRSGVSAIFGQWPGDESDEEFAAAVRDLS